MNGLLASVIGIAQDAKDDDPRFSTAVYFWVLCCICTLGLVSFLLIITLPVVQLFNRVHEPERVRTGASIINNFTMHIEVEVILRLNFHP